MQRKSRTVEIDGTSYLVEELSARVMLPLVQRIADEERNQEAQIEMMNAAITVDGQPVDAGDLGMGTFMQLMNAVQELNGMAGGDEGNDFQPEG